MTLPFSIFVLDIPDKIILGTSVNGKQLIAKVTRPANKQDDAPKDVADPQNSKYVYLGF